MQVHERDDLDRLAGLRPQPITLTVSMTRALALFDQGRQRQAELTAGGATYLQSWIELRARNFMPDCPPPRARCDVSRPAKKIVKGPGRPAVFPVDMIRYHHGSNSKRGMEHRYYLSLAFRAAASAVCMAFKTTEGEIMAADGCGPQESPSQARMAWLAVASDLVSGVVTQRELCTAIRLTGGAPRVVELQMAYIRAVEQDVDFRLSCINAQMMAEVAMTDLKHAAEDAAPKAGV